MAKEANIFLSFYAELYHNQLQILFLEKKTAQNGVPHNQCPKFEYIIAYVGDATGRY